MLEILRELLPFQHLSEESLASLSERFTTVELATDQNLFVQGDAADELYILISGQLHLLEGDAVRVHLKPISVLGELGAVMEGVVRNTTAKAVGPCHVAMIPRDVLLGFIRDQPGAGVSILHDLVLLTADKVRRDEQRIVQMRHNIIRTQKAMKMLRDEVLSKPESELSDAFHTTLESLIANNRRVNYALVPPTALGVSVRMPDGQHLPVLKVARTRLRLPSGSATEVGGQWSGVFVAQGLELPLSGTVVDVTEDEMELELDLLMTEYEEAFEEFLTKAQLLDLVV